ncbi:NIPSNAP family protein [Rhodoligotrophos ferricapiens]|uniref:NIPSNAP family protein n=1 Tax=Rhodoligotrophos ferricapiens TaxID=3069264 RepID=UPI00315D798D
MDDQHPIFELRKYRVADGRMQDEIERALSCIRPQEQGGLALFARHAIPAPLGMWRAITGPSLPCVLFLYQWPSVAARASAFESFYADAEWQRERARTNGGQEIVDRMDDLLYIGASPKPMPADRIYEFELSPSDRASDDLVAFLKPLCGNDPRHLAIRAYASLSDALNRNTESPAPRLLCAPIATGASS